MTQGLNTKSNIFMIIPIHQVHFQQPNVYTKDGGSLVDWWDTPGWTSGGPIPSVLTHQMFQYGYSETISSKIAASCECEVFVMVLYLLTIYRWNNSVHYSLLLLMSRLTIVPGIIYINNNTCWFVLLTVLLTRVMSVHRSCFNTKPLHWSHSGCLMRRGWWLHYEYAVFF